jgi:hypothetical protein
MEAIIDPQIDLDPAPVPPFRPPTILDEIASAVQAYPVTDVELELIDLDLDGQDLNVRELFSFHVRVTNRGPLTMKDVRLKAVAKNGAEVKSGGAAEQFGTEAVSANLIETIAAGDSDEGTAIFIVEAPNRAKPDGTVLVDVTLHSWNAVWDDLLNTRSDASNTPKLTFASRVVGD